MSSRDRLCRTAARSLKQRWCAAWEKPPMPRSGRSSSAGSRPGSSAKSRTLVLEGNRRDYSEPVLVSPQVRIPTEDRHPELNASQRQAVDEIFLSREKVVGLDDIAGAGKTTTLSVIREGAEAEGYRVEGFAPTSRAAQKLGEARMETSHATKASGTWTAARYRRETALCARRILPGIDQANA